MKEAKKNWKTTLFGTIAAIAGGAATIPGPHSLIAAAIATAAGSLFALFSKDADTNETK